MDGLLIRFWKCPRSIHFDTYYEEAAVMGQLRLSQKRVSMPDSCRLVKNNEICLNGNFLRSLLAEISPFEKLGSSCHPPR